MGPGVGSATLTAPDWEARTNVLDPVAHLDAVEAHLGGRAPSPREWTNARRFFAALDREANPFLIRGLVARGELSREDADQRRLAIRSVSAELRARVAGRCRALAAGVPPPERSPAAPAAPCRTVSALFLAEIERYFAGPGPAFERAFTRFANGALRIVLPDGTAALQPSSANYFLFAEFAFLAAELGVAAERWRRAANALVRTQPIFARAYAPAELAGATFDTYRGCDFAVHGRPYARDEIDALERRSRRADPEHEHARHAARFLPGLAAT